MFGSILGLSGLFVPLIMVGAAYGRLVAELLARLLPAAHVINPGTYSLGSGDVKGKRKRGNRAVLGHGFLTDHVTKDACLAYAPPAHPFPLLFRETHGTCIVELLLSNILQENLQNMMTSATNSWRMQEANRAREKVATMYRIPTPKVILNATNCVLMQVAL